MLAIMLDQIVPGFKEAGAGIVPDRLREAAQGFGASRKSTGGDARGRRRRGQGFKNAAPYGSEGGAAR